MTSAGQGDRVDRDRDGQRQTASRPSLARPARIEELIEYRLRHIIPPSNE